MLYRLTSAAVWFEEPRGLAVLNAERSMLFEGEDGEVVKEFLEQLQQPREHAELENHFGEGPLAELLDVLAGAGVVEVEDSALSSRFAPVREALSRGIAIVSRDRGSSAELATQLRAALMERGVTVEDRPSDAAALPTGSLVIGCFASIFDAAHLEMNLRALNDQAAYLPLVLDRSDVLVGPLLVDGGPCSRCVSLRLLAQRWQHFHSAWYDAQRHDAAPRVRLHPRAAALGAEYVMRYLASLDEDGAVDGKLHALLRAPLDKGVADVRRVLRHSHCRACGPRPPALATVQPDVLRQAQLEVARHWERILKDDPESLRPEPHIEEMYRDGLTGVLQHGEEWAHRRSYFRNLPQTWGGLALCREEEYVTTWMQGMNGTGPDLEHLRLIMFSEGLERYGQYNHRPAVENVSYEDVRSHAFDPRELTLYDDEQYANPDFPRPRFREEMPLNWSWGYGLLSKQAKLFPQEVVTVSISDDHYPNRILDQRLTTGGASHVSYTKALNNCLRELLERDQLMIAWYKRIPLPRVAIPERTGNEYVDGLLTFLRARGVKLDLFDMRLDFPVPSFLLLATVEERQGDFHPGGTVGAAAADLDPVNALARTLGEMRIHYETLALTPDPMKDYRQNPYDPNDMKQGWRLWWPNYMWHLNPENRRAFDFLLKSDLAKEERSIDDMESFERGDAGRNRDELLRCFERVGLEPWAWDIGCEETSPSGFKIVKVEVPGIVHLVPGRQSRRLACRRFEEVAKGMGRSCLPAGEQNPDPHVQA